MKRRATARRRMRAPIALLPIALAGCAARRSTPPIVGNVHVDTTGGAVFVEVGDLVNTGTRFVEVCVENVVISRADEQGPSCTALQTGPCYIVAPSSTASNVRFQTPVTCPGIDPAASVVLADLKWRPWPGANAWRSMTIIDSSPRSSVAR